MDFVTLMFVGLSIFFIGYYAGKVMHSIESSKEKNHVVALLQRRLAEAESRQGDIDGDSLIAWIENKSHNYEYDSPPTTREIIRQIRKMKGR